MVLIKVLINVVFLYTIQGAFLSFALLSMCDLAQQAKLSNYKKLSIYLKQQATWVSIPHKAAMTLVCCVTYIALLSLRCLNIIWTCALHALNRCNHLQRFHSQ